jgi:UDP-4-amino-4,6-dideoxy-N-acetyl-beta-L-altrosamine transaminase
MEFLPYGRQLIEDDDVAAVVAALRSERLAHGPRVETFERAFAGAAGAAEAVACSSGTAALQLALMGLDVGPGDLCVVPGMTFLATASAALWCGAEVVFADVDPDTGLMTPDTLEEALERAGRAVKAVLPVHLAGRVCDLAGLEAVAARHGAVLVEDACHAVGGLDQDGRPAGAAVRSAAAAFSLHPVKTLAAGEGGMVTTNDPEYAARLRRLRNHGVTHDAAMMVDPALSLGLDGRPHPWAYEQLELGHSLRMNEMEAALGASQLAKLPRFAERRRALAARYDEALASLAPVVAPAPTPKDGQRACLHLYVVLIDAQAAGLSRGDLMRALAERGIGTQVHYIPPYRQPLFARRYGAQRLPGAEAYYSRCLALPLFPAMADGDVERVADALREIVG